MNLNVVFDVPAAVLNGLTNGSLERVGGVIRDASSKQVVMWLQEGGTQVSRSVGTPPLASGARAIAAANPILSAANLGVSVAGFALVLQQLNRISDQIRVVEAKVDRVSDKLDDQVLARLKAGINACQNALEQENPALRIQLVGQAMMTLHEARQYFNQQVVRSAGKADSASAYYVTLAFVALAAEAQTHLQLDDSAKAARVIREGLEALRPGLTQLMNAVLDHSCHYLRPEFASTVDLDLILWLHNGLRRMQRDPNEMVACLTASELFNSFRTKISKVFTSHEEWHGQIPQVIVDTSDVPDWWLGPINQGADKDKRFKLIKQEVPMGLNRIVAMVEAYDRLTGQALQLEEMTRIVLKPSELPLLHLLPEGKAAAVVLDSRWISVEVPA
jgi:hypothetical protein